VSRRFRWLGKKRGERRTDSRRLGSYGEAAFFAALFFIGAVGTYLLLVDWILPEWHANLGFEKGECRVVATRVSPKKQEGATLYRPEVQIRYTVEGQTYTVWTYDANWKHALSKPEAESLVQPFEVGKQYHFWYAPDKPSVAVLVRGYSWWRWLLLIVPASFMIAGATGGVLALLASGTSAERRAAMAQKAPRLDLDEDESSPGHGYPTLPSCSHINDSPGTHLAFRLPVEAATSWQLAGMAAVTFLWNGIVLWLLVNNVRTYLAGEEDVLLSLLLLPLFGIGIGLAYYTARQFFLSSGPGQTRLEIEDHPLYPGRSYEIYLAQAGRVRIESLRVDFVCEEQATFRQGTETRTERVSVYEDCLYRQQGIEIAPGEHFEDRFHLRVPEGAMHSFHSEHNEIRWKMVVRGRMHHLPDYQRAFSLVVFPPRAQDAQA